jgi:hypothetical protein
MDYISGEPLDEHVASHRLDTAEILRLSVQVCGAVNAMHLKGIIHRDLKPSNIRVDDAGNPHVLDLGLAKMQSSVSSFQSPVSGNQSPVASNPFPVTGRQSPSESPSPASVGAETRTSKLETGNSKRETGNRKLETDFTLTGQFLGSRPWASPEQAEGRTALIDLRTDVYSLGVVLFRVLTGHLPYNMAGSMREVLDHIVHAEPLRPRKLGWYGRPGRGIDDELETIILKCLRKDPARRYQSAGELARDIEHYLVGEPIESKRDSAAYVLGKTLRRHRAPVVAAALILALLSGGTVVSTVLWRRASAAAATGWLGTFPANDLTKYRWMLNDVPEGDASRFFIAPFSSREFAGQELDIAAPGFAVPVPITINGQVDYTLGGGTSQATPHFAGVAVLMLQKNPTLTQAEVESILKSTALSLPTGCADLV